MEPTGAADGHGCEREEAKAGERGAERRSLVDRRRAGWERSRPAAPGPSGLSAGKQGDSGEPSPAVLVAWFCSSCFFLLLCIYGDFCWVPDIVILQCH